MDGKQVLVTRVNSNKGTSVYKIPDRAQSIYLLKVSGEKLNVVTKIVVL